MNESTVLANMVWVLPRPRLPYYKGGVPLHFEKRLWRLLGKPLKEEILQPFGGLAEYGTRVDVLKEVHPDLFGDAHLLPFTDCSFKVVICDPPYSGENAVKMYGFNNLKEQEWIKETGRVTAQRGFLVIYHEKWIPRPKDFSFWARIIVLLKAHHSARICSIFQKDG